MISEKEAVEIIDQILKKNGMERKFEVEFVKDPKNKAYNMYWNNKNYEKLQIEKANLENKKDFVSLLGHELVHYREKDETKKVQLTKEAKVNNILQECRADIEGYKLVKDFVSKEEYLGFLEKQKRTEVNMKNPEKQSFRLGYPCYDKRVEFVAKYDSFTDEAKSDIKRYYNKPKFDMDQGIKR